MSKRKNKGRHNNDNQKKKMCYRYADGTHCEWFDGDGITTFDKECGYPWSGRCKDGNIYNCQKLKFQYLASLPEDKRRTFLDTYKMCKF